MNERKQRVPYVHFDWRPHTPEGRSPSCARTSYAFVAWCGAAPADAYVNAGEIVWASKHTDEVTCRKCMSHPRFQLALLAETEL